MGKRYDRNELIDVLNEAAARGCILAFAEPGGHVDGTADGNGPKWDIRIDAEHMVNLNTPQAWAFALGFQATFARLARPNLTLL